MPAALRLSLAIITLLLAAPAAAKGSYDSPYTYEQTFGTTLRLLKVDLELEVSETNAEWGYLLFVYTSRESGQRKNRGSFSFVKTERAVQVTLQLPELPSYHEQHILQKLRHKLEEEHGAPPPPPKKSKPKPKPSEDGEKEKDEKKDEPAEKRRRG